MLFMRSRFLISICRMNEMEVKHEIVMAHSRNVLDYKLIFESFIQDFGYGYYHTILTWCGIIDDDSDPELHWQIYLVKDLSGNVLGICGLYSLRPGFEELWLGWFGVIPCKRGLGLGKEVLTFLKGVAASLGAKKLMSYVDFDGAPLGFYYKQGFKRVCNVQEYLNINPEISDESFESMEDHIIEFDLLNL